MQKIKRPTGEVIFILDENDSKLATEGAVSFKRAEWDYIARLLTGYDQLIDKSNFLDGCVESKRKSPSWNIFDSFPVAIIDATEEIFKDHKKEERKHKNYAISSATIEMLKGTRTQK